MTSLTWPADRFYWAVLDAPGVRAGLMPSGLAASLQDEIPVDVDTLHAVAIPIDSARVLVCAVKREDLTALPPEVLSLTPSDFPDFPALATDVLTDTPALRLPELLTGPFEPKPLRRERARRTSLLAASILLTAALLSTGLLRRASSLHEHAEAARTHSATLLRDAISSGNLDALTRETTRYQSLATTPHALTPPDAAAALASLLRTWPDGAACEANSVSITPTTMSLAFSLDSDPRPLLASLKAPAGWSLEEPRLASTANNTRVTLTLKRIKEGARSSRALLVLAILAACVMLGWSTRNYLGARAEADTATTLHTNISTQAQRLDQLRASAPSESRRLPPPPGLASRIAATVSAAGLAHSSLQTVTPEVETPAAGGTFRRTAVRVTLDQITLPELGRWLDEWRKAEPAWVVSSIDLSPTAANRKGPQRTLRAGLSIEYIFAAAPKEPADANP